MPKSLPVLVGAGQITRHWPGDDGPPPSPLSLATAAAQRALADAGIGASDLDTLIVQRTYEDSVPFGHPFGENDNLPGTLAREIGARPQRAIYGEIGGQSPQRMVNEIASRICEGEIECALLAGGEAIGAAKAARRGKLALDWADSANLPFEDRKSELQLLIRPEIKQGLVVEAYFYGLIENAIAAREGRTRTEHRAAMARLLAPFSEVASANPYAQFPTPRSEAFLKTPSKENYAFVDPFLKWHVAQDSVNQGAAIIMMSNDRADELGIPANKRVYLHGTGDADEHELIHRPKLDQSWAMNVAVDHALETAGCSAGDVSVFDLYSCFPCAVTCAAEALGLNPYGDTRTLTVTGGLPFFGGPGNNYSLHAIASMVESLHDRPGEFGLVLANGGWLTKESVGVYCTTLPDNFEAKFEVSIQPDKVELEAEPSRGTLESFTIGKDRDGNRKGIIFARTAEGRRFAADASPKVLALLEHDESLVGTRLVASTQNEVHTVELA